MRTDRLLQLADHLLTVNPLLFDINFFGKESECGTVCCAGGHATTIFKELELCGDNAEDMGLQTKIDGIWYEDYEALSALFDISSTKATYLFYPGSYTNPTPQDVSDRIRKVVMEYKQERKES